MDKTERANLIFLWAWLEEARAKGNGLQNTVISPNFVTLLEQNNFFLKKT
jgi:hypothetical protein